MGIKLSEEDKEKLEKLINSNVIDDIDGYAVIDWFEIWKEVDSWE